MNEIYLLMRRIKNNTRVIEHVNKLHRDSLTAEDHHPIISEEEILIILSLYRVPKTTKEIRELLDDEKVSNILDPLLNRMSDMGLLSRKNDRIALTDKGRKIAETVIDFETQ